MADFIQYGGTNGGKYANQFQGILRVWEENVNNQDNTSQVVYQLILKSGSGGRFSDLSASYSVNINGQLVKSGSGRYSSQSYNTEQIICDGRVTITHNSDGAKSVWCSCSLDFQNHTYSPGDFSPSGNLDLTKIPRYTTVWISQRGRTSSSISVNWSTADPRDWTQYSLNGGPWTNAYETVDSANKNGNFTISGLSENTKYTVKVQCKRTDSQLWSQSGTIEIWTFAKTKPTIRVTSRTSTSISVDSSCNVTTSDVVYAIGPRSSPNYGPYQHGKTFTGLTPGTQYDIKVLATGKDSGEKGSAKTSEYTFEKTIPQIALKSKTVNSIEVSFSCNVATSEVKYRIGPRTSAYGSYQSSPIFKNLQPNTLYDIQVYAVGRDSGESNTHTISITTYDIAKLTSVPNINLGDSLTVAYNNPSSSQILVGIYSENSETSLCAYRKASGTSYTFNFSQQELDTLYKAFKKSDKLTINAYIRTISNSIEYNRGKLATITLTGNQKTGHININGTYRRTKRFKRINGNWRRFIRWRNVNGVWERSI